MLIRRKVSDYFVNCQTYFKENLFFCSFLRTFDPMKQAMIFAAGLGTRLKPLTDTMPKALVKVGGQPLLDLVIRRLHEQGYHRLVVNVHHFSQQIIDHLAAADFLTGQCPCEVLISDESEKLLDTGGGLKKAASLFSDDEPILIHNVDILDNVDYNWFRRQHLDDEDAVLLVSRRKTKRYLLFDSSMRLMGWTNMETGEVKSPYPWLRQGRLAFDPSSADEGSDYPVSVTLLPSPLKSPLPFGEGLGVRLHLFAFSGIHSFSPRLFRLMDRFPDRFPIMDFYLSTCHRARIYGCLKDDLQVLDVGKLDSLEAAERFQKTISD